MSYKTRLFINDEWMDSERVEVIQTSENWNTYALFDGSTIRMKTVVFSIWRIPGKFDARGNPLYWVESNNVLDIMSPEELKNYEGKGRPIL